MKKIQIQKTLFDQKITPLVANLVDRYGWVDQETIDTLTAALLADEAGAVVRFHHDTSYDESCLRWHQQRSAKPLGVAKATPMQQQNGFANLTSYLELQHPMIPEIDASIHLGNGGIIAITVVGQKASSLWSEVLANRLRLQDFEPHIVQHTPLGKEFIYLFRTDSTVDFNRLPSAATIWGDSENRVNLLLHSCTVALPGSREFHTGVGQIQFPAGRWGTAATMQPHEVSAELAYVLHLLQHDASDAVKLYNNFREVCSGLGSETKDQVLRDWSTRHCWEKIFTKLAFSRLSVEPDCSHVGCGVWSPDPKSSLKIAAHTSTCARAMRGMPCIECAHTGSGHPLELSAIRAHEKFNSSKPLPKRFRMKMFDVVAVTLYHGNWKRAYAMEGISLPEKRSDRKES